jgi:trehalose-6-phosphatase
MRKPQVESLLSAVARAPRSLLVLDYDGALAPFRKDPEQAFPYPSPFRAVNGRGLRV